jgi:hypothetical protein
VFDVTVVSVTNRERYSVNQGSVLDCRNSTNHGERFHVPFRSAKDASNCWSSNTPAAFGGDKLGHDGEFGVLAAPPADFDAHDVKGAAGSGSASPSVDGRTETVACDV